jgi:hypothetical protein
MATEIVRRVTTVLVGGANFDLAAQRHAIGVAGALARKKDARRPRLNKNAGSLNPTTSLSTHGEVMRHCNRLLFVILSFSIAGCVDLTAVNDFAKESSLITANKAMLDDTDAQTEARKYNSSYVDPTSKAFTDRLVVTNHALDALNAYMTVLAQLSANDVANVSSDFSAMGTGLKDLHVTEPTVQSGLNAASALTNMLLDAAVRTDIKKLLTAGAQPVADITTYLIDQAQTTENTYNQAIAVNNQYWGDLTKQTRTDEQFCKTANVCSAVYLLATRARDGDSKVLSAKAAAAGAAVKALRKIRADNAALVEHVDHLDAKAVVQLLKNDEPDLMTAIRNLRTL